MPPTVARATIAFMAIAIAVPAALATGFDLTTTVTASGSASLVCTAESDPTLVHHDARATAVRIDTVALLADCEDAVARVRVVTDTGADVVTAWEQVVVTTAEQDVALRTPVPMGEITSVVVEARRGSVLVDLTRGGGR